MSKRFAEYPGDLPGERGRGKGAGGDLALTRFVKLEPKESERGIRNL